MVIIRIPLESNLKEVDTDMYIIILLSFLFYINISFKILLIIFSHVFLVILKK